MSTIIVLGDGPTWACPFLVSWLMCPKSRTGAVDPVRHEHRTSINVRPELVEGADYPTLQLGMQGSRWPLRPSCHLVTSRFGDPLNTPPGESRGYDHLERGVGDVPPHENSPEGGRAGTNNLLLLRSPTSYEMRQNATEQDRNFDSRVGSPDLPTRPPPNL